MNTPQTDGPALARSAADALRRGDPRTARDLFLQAARAGQVDVPVFMGLAFACLALEDWPGVAASTDRVLLLDPRNLRALIMRGDVHERDGDSRAAAAYYLTALRSAPPADRAPPDLLPELRRVQQKHEQFTQRYTQHVLAYLQQRGFDMNTQADTRFGESVDLLLGRRRLYVQQPVYYYFPQLPQRQFFELDAFAGLAAVAAAAADIRAELDLLLQDPAAFGPYVQGPPNRANVDPTGLVNNPDWSACHLRRNGQVVELNAARCPRTLAALASVSQPDIAGRAPSVLFASLQPGKRIPPHNGLVNTRLICHLPLLVPGKCRLRVGNEIRELQAGKAVVFDDTINNEAWNDGDGPLVYLAFDIARPELTATEHELVGTLFDAIDAFGGQKQSWGI
jgi:hypothetical protein